MNEIRNGKSLQLANEFRPIADSHALDLTQQAHRLLSLADARRLLPHNNISVRTQPVQAALATEFTAHAGVEVSLDFVLHRSSGQYFYLFTRGVDPDVAISDTLLYFGLHPHFVITPRFHTHTNITNDYGDHQPSNADLANLLLTMKQHHHFDLSTGITTAHIHFPDGATTTYWVDERQIRFFSLTPDGQQTEFIPNRWNAIFFDRELDEFIAHHPKSAPLLNAHRSVGDQREQIINCKALREIRTLVDEGVFRELVLTYSTALFDFKPVTR